MPCTHKLRFAANLTMLFTELPFWTASSAAARPASQAVEYLFPYHSRRRTRCRCKPTACAGAAQPARRQLGRGRARHRLPPERVDEFRAGVGQAIEVRHRAGLQAAQLPGRHRARRRATRAAARGPGRQPALCRRRAEGAGLRLLIEPINTFDIPGFYLNRTDQALALIDEVGATTFLQYDIYHAQRMEGELAATLARHLPRIAHIQLADNPGRHEPGTGEINWPWLFERIARRWATAAGSAANTSRAPPPPQVWAGARH
jgi:hydroxypyruvate isomerase